MQPRPLTPTKPKKWRLYPPPKDEGFTRFGINIDKFSTTSESLYTIASLSLKYNLTSYDASYLELAIRVDAMIATLDKNFILACNLANVKVY